MSRSGDSNKNDIYIIPPLYIFWRYIGKIVNKKRIVCDGIAKFTCNMKHMRIQIAVDEC